MQFNVMSGRRFDGGQHPYPGPWTLGPRRINLVQSAAWFVHWSGCTVALCQARREEGRRSGKRARRGEGKAGKAVKEARVGVGVGVGVGGVE